MFRALFLALLFWHSASAQPALPSAKIAAIRSLAEAELARSGAPGFAIAVGLNNQLAWEEGFGLADVEHGVRAQPHTRFRTGSIAKPITATAVLQLAESGRIDLDAPISRYVPEFPHDEVTARHVLGHLSGIRHYRGDEFASVRRYESLTDALQVFVQDDLLFSPGREFSYTTYGYNLLGAVVERTSGEDFMEYIARRVFEPAGMTRTVADDHYRIVAGRTRFYRRVGDERQLENAQPADTSVKIPGGGLLSTACDLVRFAGAVNSGRLLEDVTVERAFVAQKLNSGEEGAVGLGWFVDEFQGERRVGHGGGQQGTTARLELLPESGTIAVILSNLEAYPEMQVLTDRLLEIIKP